jgi:hypothetical protein
VTEGVEAAVTMCLLWVQSIEAVVLRAAQNTYSSLTALASWRLCTSNDSTRWRRVHWKKLPLFPSEVLPPMQLSAPPATTGRREQGPGSRRKVGGRQTRVPEFMAHSTVSVLIFLKFLRAHARAPAGGAERRAKHEYRAPGVRWAPSPWSRARRHTAFVANLTLTTLQRTRAAVDTHDGRRGLLPHSNIIPPNGGSIIDFFYFLLFVNW